MENRLLESKSEMHSVFSRQNFESYSVLHRIRWESVWEALSSCRTQFPNNDLDQHNGNQTNLETGKGVESKHRKSKDKRTRYSSLTAEQQRKYLMLFKKYSSQIVPNPTVSQRKEMKLLSDLYQQVLKEQEELNDYLKRGSVHRGKDYCYLHTEARRFLKEKLSHRLSLAFTYPRHYTVERSISVSSTDEDSNHSTVLHFNGTVLELGRIPRLVQLSLDKPCVLPLSYSRLKKYFLLSDKPSDDEHPSKKPISQDTIARHIAEKNAADVALSMSAILALAEITSPHFEELCLPIHVAELNTKNGVPRKCVFVDKPVLQHLTVRKMSTLYHKYATKIQFTRFNPGKWKRARQTESAALSKDVPDSGLRRMANADRDIFGGTPTDISDLETFGIGDFKVTTDKEDKVLQSDCMSSNSLPHTVEDAISRKMDVSSRQKVKVGDSSENAFIPKIPTNPIDMLIEDTVPTKIHSSTNREHFSENNKHTEKSGDSESAKDISAGQDSCKLQFKTPNEVDEKEVKSKAKKKRAQLFSLTDDTSGSDSDRLLIETDTEDPFDNEITSADSIEIGSDDMQSEKSSSSMSLSSVQSSKIPNQEIIANQTVLDHNYSVITKNDILSDNAESPSGAVSSRKDENRALDSKEITFPNPDCNELQNSKANVQAAEETQNKVPTSQTTESDLPIMDASQTFLTKIEREDPSLFPQPDEKMNVSYGLWTLGGFRLLIRRKTDCYQSTTNKPWILFPKLEYQSEYGAEVTTPNENMKQLVKLIFHPSSQIYRVRINALTSEVLMLEEVNMQEIALASCPSQHDLIIQHLSDIFKHLLSLDCGQFLLSHTKGASNATLYHASELNKRGNFDLHTEANLRLSVVNDIESSMGEISLQNIGGVGKSNDKHIPWLPIDAKVQLPSLIKENRIPGTFPPLITQRKVSVAKKGKNKK